MIQTSLQSLSGKRIVLGIGGGIAAYKCADLSRRLIERGAQIRVVMTHAAKKFITPLTMQAVSGHPVLKSLLDLGAETAMDHIEIAKWADFVLLAPATADLIARIAAGMGNDLLTTIYLATDAPVAFAPGMNQQMYRAIATQENIATLSRRGHPIWGPASGKQACGDIGIGRMLEPLQLVALIENYFIDTDLSGLSLLITAGPTREAIDPVRYLSNHSSGKMGYAIAEAASKRGARVTLVSGPVNLPTPANVNRINVQSAEEMHVVVQQHAGVHQIFVACAAVADFKPATMANQKMKKKDGHDEITLSLTKNPDILASVAAMTDNRPFTVGFAAETQDVEQYARDKLAKKNLNLICANDVSQQEQGCDSDQNTLHLYWPNGDKILPLASKVNIGHQLVGEIVLLFHGDK
ncbi:bifunctional phosphopantothenoylcysteine decarboxylase/phosphopantothenate--cysteine ligase CoaBC [Candidatus Enterovibrio altilux]|uniref:Coenzyme A biosynthesis bifunctional protein CoaBC n=1 Tax=Candidatus Enterovibrio altilux TaxID=1927128 RepID=A0A291B8Q1_9GAMM|nr:bifunctional phosphopantothenoylcysteine decarboxylase/phosphopantothenate--cysteine ligase CoaBC [Candidatus Enterovibrio luxaltus]ATF09371.1 Phosphopantothenoylcysteine decarboxylase [Candidatus Enterovibrio luxaltus]